METYNQKFDVLTREPADARTPPPAQVQALAPSLSNLQENKCYKCDRLFKTHNDLRIHVATEHGLSLANVLVEPNIPQVDGNDSISDDSNHGLEVVELDHDTSLQSTDMEKVDFRLQANFRG